MTLAWVTLAPLTVQSVAMGFDELYFHRRRGLGTWERVGHPLDTLTTLGCLAWALFNAPRPANIAIYVGLCVLSCAFITKDEIIHARRCTPGEHWIHAVLFIVHPVSLGSAGLLWIWQPAVGRLLPAFGFASMVLTVQLVVTAIFCAYQALYWNLPWIRRSPVTP